MTDLSALEPIARNLLDKHGDAGQALPHLRRLLLKRIDLLDLLALAYLEAVADPDPGQASDDAHGIIAGRAAAGHRFRETHAGAAGGGPKPKPAKPIKVREHRRARARTDADRDIAVIAMEKNLRGVFDRPILGKAIGDFFFRELRELRSDLTGLACEHILLGAQKAEEALLIDKILCHAVIGGDVRVRDALAEQTLVRLGLEARREVMTKLDVSKGAAQTAFVEQLEYRAS